MMLVTRPTETVAEPLFVVFAVDVAVMMTVPVLVCAVTRPVPLTVAIAGFDDDHVTVWLTPGSAVTAATSCTVPPERSPRVAGDTLTDTTSPTVTCVVPDFVGSVTDAAVIVAEPRATPVTSPAALTIAMLVLEDDQVRARLTPGSASTVAVGVVVPPMRS